MTDKVKEAIEILKEAQEFMSAFHPTEIEAFKTLLDLAQQVLDAKMPKKLNNPHNCEYENGYNNAIDKTRLWQVKCLGELEKLLEDEFDKRGHYFKAEISNVAQALITYLEGGREDDTAKMQ